MKKTLLCFGAVLLGSFVAAHVTPMYPIEIETRLEGTRLRLSLEAAALEWVEDVLGRPDYPAGEWGQEERDKSERFINAHFVLAQGGQTLPGRVLGGRILQQPWQSSSSARVRIRLVYDLPPGDGPVEGRAFFFKGEWDLHEGAGKPLDGLERRFETILTVRGAKTFVVTIPIQRPDFLLKRQDMSRSGAQQKLESFTRGLGLRAPLILWGMLMGFVNLRSSFFLWAALGYGMGLFLPTGTFPFSWAAPFVGAGMVLFPAPWGGAMAALLSGILGGLGTGLNAKEVGALLGFEALSSGLFGVGGLFSAAVGMAVGAVILWLVKRSATVRRSDRVMEERERAGRFLSMAVAAFSLVWVWRGWAP